MRNKVLLVLMCGLLSACSTTYNKPGATQQEFQKDLYECQRDANMAGAGFNGQGMFQAAVIGNTRQQCMAARGYTQQ